MNTLNNCQVSFKVHAQFQPNQLLRTLTNRCCSTYDEIVIGGIIIIIIIIIIIVIIIIIIIIIIRREGTSVAHANRFVCSKLPMICFFRGLSWKTCKASAYQLM